MNKQKTQPETDFEKYVVQIARGWKHIFEKHYEDEGMLSDKN